MFITRVVFFFFFKVYYNIHTKKIQVGDLGEGYNVVTCPKEETFTLRLGVALT